MKALFTIGYEQATPTAIIDGLRTAGVELVADIRAVAASRKPGFSKRQLAAALEESGIAYLHLQKLGTPTEGREAARAGDLAKLWRIYNRHLKTAGAIEELEVLQELIKSGRSVCLLCYERDAAHCHRSRVAKVMQKRTGASITNLMPVSN